MEKRIALFSDTHGHSQALREAINDNGCFDIIFHLGDGVRDGLKIAQELGLPFYGVMGNEDYGIDLPEKQAVEVDNLTFFLSHGHRNGINRYQKKDVFKKNLIKIGKIAKKENATVILFGHTHQPYLEEIDDLIYCNPGNQYLGAANPPTFGVLNLMGDILEITIMLNRSKGKWSPILEYNSQIVIQKRGIP